MTNNLDGPRVAPGQNQKEQTINDSVGHLDAAMTKKLSKAFSDEDVLTLAEFTGNFFFELLPGNVSGAWTLYVPAGVSRGMFVVINNSGEAVDIAVDGGMAPYPGQPDGAGGQYASDGQNIY